MLIFLNKSFVAEHLRYLKNGKSVKVQAHYTKRVKKHTEHALPHSHNLDHLSDADKDLFNRMHAEQHVAHFYDGHALRKRVAHHEGEAQKHNDHAAQLDKDGKHKEAAAARRKADKHIAEMHRHKAELRKVDNAVHGLAAMKEKLVAGSGALEGDAEAIHQHYVSKVGERLKPLSKPAPAPIQSKPVAFAKPVEPLDHGVLNIPGRTNSINAELDKYKAQKAKEDKAESKRVSAQNKTDKAEAKELFGKHADDIVAKMSQSEKLKEQGATPKSIRETLDSMAQWEPAKFIKFVERFLKEQEAAESAPTDPTPAPTEPKVLFVQPSGQSAIPENATVAGVRSFTVNKIGRKWIEVSMGTKGYKTKLAISPETAGYEVGGQYSAGLMKVEKTSKYGSSTEFYIAPAGSEGSPEVIKDTKTKAEIERWLGYVESKAKEGWLYENGVSQLQQLGVKHHPEYNERLNAAREQVKQVKAARQAAWAKEKAAQQAERDAKKTETAARRILYPTSNAPHFGVPVFKFGKWIVFESSGKVFKLDESHPSLHGSHLLGHEGSYGAYYYFRDAKPEEIPQAAATPPDQSMTLQQQLDDVQRKYDSHQLTFNEGGDGYNPHAAKLKELKGLVHKEAVAKREKELLDNAEEYKKRWNAAVQKYTVNGQINTTDLQKVAAEAGLTVVEQMWLKDKMQAAQAEKKVLFVKPEAPK